LSAILRVISAEYKSDSVGCDVFRRSGVTAVNRCAATRREHPLTVIGVGFDFMDLGFAQPIQNSETLAARIAGDKRSWIRLQALSSSHDWAP
jgi:hypothetical protein